jgi:hypothetical protein
MDISSCCYPVFADVEIYPGKAVVPLSTGAAGILGIQRLPQWLLAQHEGQQAHP